ncbi:MAG: hypothetical protein H0W04_03515 [Chthoniobacterales bacterium]|nr:hypothetical protein [Chthoniobacterales bacterium]
MNKIDDMLIRRRVMFQFSEVPAMSTQDTPETDATAERAMWAPRGL